MAAWWRRSRADRPPVAAISEPVDVQMQSGTCALGETGTPCLGNLQSQDRILREILHANPERLTLRDDVRDLLRRHEHAAQIQCAARAVQRKVFRVIASDHHNGLTKPQSIR
jgi:hypothetical protein